MTVDELQSAFEALQRACRLLETQNQHDIAAITSHAMALLTERFGIGVDHISERAS